MSKREKFIALLHELDVGISYDHRFGGTRVFIYPGDNFGYAYRQLAYFTSTWEDVYITGVAIDSHITIYFEGEEFELYECC